MTPIKIKSLSKPNILNIRWSPSNVCNFKCDYCFPGSNEGNFKSPVNTDVVIANFQHLFKEYTTKLGKTKFHLDIGGGEPTVWKDLDKFILEIKKSNDVYVSVTSNGSRTLRWWKDNGHLIDNATLSHHVKESNIDHMIEVADTLYALNKKVTVLVLMDPTRWDECVAAVEYMKASSKYPWFVLAKEVVGYLPYTKLQKQYMSKELKRLPNLTWFLKNYNLIFDGSIKIFESAVWLEDKTLPVMATSNTYINHGWTNFTGWNCNIGLDSIYVNWDGIIQGACGQPLFDQRYNMLDSNFINLFDPEFKQSKCQIACCSCIPETHLTKSLS
jgi:organic radical activating enzyme